MEESEDRKLRLKAMRREADEAEASPNINTSTVSAHLSNPLAEFANLPMQDCSPVSARFEFYTDPVAAFSGNRRKCQKTYENSPNYVSPPLSSASPGPRNLSTTPSPSHNYNQSQSHSSDQGMYGSPLPHHTPGSWRSSTGTVSPSPQQLGTPTFSGTPGNSFTPNSRIGDYPPNPPMPGGYPPNPNFRGGFRPSPSSGRGRGYQFNNISNHNFGQGDSPSPNAGRSGRSQFSNSPNTGSGWGGSPSFSTGRGGGHHFSGSNPGRGSGHRGGRGSHGNVSARERPDLFYHKSMLEDPWMFLVPVVYKLAVAEENSSTPGSLNSWLPKSIRGKNKALEGVTPVRSGASFAAALAASYEEATALAASYEETASSNDVNNV